MKLIALKIFLTIIFCLVASAEEYSESTENTTTEQKEEVAQEPEKKDKEKPKKQAATGHPFSWPFMTWEKMKPYGGNSQGSKTVLDKETRESYKAIYEEGITKKEQDRRAIKAIEGDYRVSFDFIETAGAVDGYKPQRPYFSWATERAFIIEEKENFISIQHIMVMEFLDEEGEVQGPFTMKHWRQDWTYEDTDHHFYIGDKTWKRVKGQALSGSWSQTVYQVDDSPRYEAVGTWSHVGGLSTFTSSDFWRPLPRREFSIRKDYNVLAGTHQLILNPTGWLHLQNNRKVVVEDGKIQKTLATELGAVRYQQITTPELTLAADYWKKTSPYWDAIRKKWSEVYAENKEFTLQKRFGGRGLFMHHFAHAGELEQETPPEIEGIIKKGLQTIDDFLSEYVTEIRDITVNEVKADLKTENSPTVLDLRTAEEFEAGHIEGAVNVDFKSDNFSEKLKELDRNQRYIVHCKSGGRSTKALSVFQELHFERIDHLSSGFDGWKKEK